MSATTWKATIKLPNGSYQEVRIQADSMVNAKLMLQAQYGKGNVLTDPQRVI